MKKLIFATVLLASMNIIGCKSEPEVSGISDESSSSSSTTNQCTTKTTQVVDYGYRRTAGAALNVRGAFSDIKINPVANYPAFVFGETNTTAGVSTIKYQYWNGSEFKIETVVGGLTATFIRLVFLSTGRPLVFWGNGATALYMGSRSTASITEEGTWTVGTIDTSSTAIRAIEASVNPDDQVLVSFAVNTTSAAVKAALCTSNCHLKANYAQMTGDLDSAAGTAMTTMGIGWCAHASGYYPMVLYSDTASAVLTTCRDATLSNCSTGTNWATDITLTGSGANLVANQLYVDSSTVDSTVYMVSKHSGGLRPYSYASCATSGTATAADPGTNYVVNTATVGNTFFNLGFDGSNFHIVANDAQTMLKYFNQPLATFGSANWNASGAPHVETTGAAGLAAAGLTRGGLAIDSTGDQILASYGRTLAVTPTQTLGNVVLAYNDCPTGSGAPACAATTLGSEADSTAMYWGNAPLDSTGQIQRNILQVPNVSAAATSDGIPATAYIDFSVGISAEPATGALLKYAYRNGSTASDQWIYSIIPTNSAPQSPSLAFDHLDHPWISWYETAVSGFRYYLATNSRSDGKGNWTVYAYPISDAAGAPTLPAMNQTSLAMHWSSGVARPVLIMLRNPTANKGVHAARFNPTTGQWDYQQQIMSLTGTTTPGGAWLTSTYDESGNIAVAIHDLGTGASASCSPTTSRCVRITYSTNGGSTWATSGQIYSGTAEGLNIKLNPSDSRPAVSFYNRALNVLRYKYCSTAMATCTSSSNWADVDTGVVDAITGTSGLVDNGAAANAGLMNSSLTFSSEGDPWIIWSRGAGAIVNANLMYSSYSSSSSTTFSSPAVLKYNSTGNESTPVAANAGNFALSWNAASVRTSTGSLHTIYVGPGNFLYATSCGN